MPIASSWTALGRRPMLRMSGITSGRPGARAAPGGPRAARDGRAARPPSEGSRAAARPGATRLVCLVYPIRAIITRLITRVSDALPATAAGLMLLREQELGHVAG